MNDELHRIVSGYYTPDGKRVWDCVGCGGQLPYNTYECPVCDSDTFRFEVGERVFVCHNASSQGGYTDIIARREKLPDGTLAYYLRGGEAYPQRGIYKLGQSAWEQRFRSQGKVEDRE